MIISGPCSLSELKEQLKDFILKYGAGADLTFEARYVLCMYTVTKNMGPSCMFAKVEIN